MSYLAFDLLHSGTQYQWKKSRPVAKEAEKSSDEQHKLNVDDVTTPMDEVMQEAGPAAKDDGTDRASDEDHVHNGDDMTSSMDVDDPDDEDCSDEEYGSDDGDDSDDEDDSDDSDVSDFEGEDQVMQEVVASINDEAVGDTEILPASAEPGTAEDDSDDEDDSDYKDEEQVTQEEVESTDDDEVGDTELLPASAEPGTAEAKFAELTSCLLMDLNEDPTVTQETFERVIKTLRAKTRVVRDLSIRLALAEHWSGEKLALDVDTLAVESNKQSKAAEGVLKHLVREVAELRKGLDELKERNSQLERKFDLEASSNGVWRDTIDTVKDISDKTASHLAGVKRKFDAYQEFVKIVEDAVTEGSERLQSSLQDGAEKE